MSHPFRQAVEARDIDAATATLHDDVVFRSPVVHKPYEGKPAVSFLLGLVIQVFEDFEYVAELHDGDSTMLEFRARVGDREVHGIDLVRVDAAGLITDFTVMIRPLSGALALRDAMGARLEAAQGS